MSSTNEQRRHRRLTAAEKAEGAEARHQAFLAAQRELDHAAALETAASYPPLTDEQRAKLRPLLDLSDLDGGL